MRRAGFTLIEMLIALTIFGMLTAAGVALLTLTVRTQETSDRLLGEVGELRRLGALMTADLGQAAARTSRDRDGRPRPALTGTGGDDALLLGLVRRGGNEGALQRVEYWLREGRIERVAYDAVDGESRAVAMPLLGHVRQLRLRYRDREGDWRAAWDPTDATLLPRAVELVSRDDAHGAVRQLFLVGGGAR
jgi:general secretion pathway protein J